jgi:hypothetical protein
MSHAVISSPGGAVRSVWHLSRLCAEADLDRAERDAPVIRAAREERKKNLAIWHARGLRFTDHVEPASRRGDANARRAECARRQVLGGPRAATLTARIVAAMMEIGGPATLDQILPRLAAKDRDRLKLHNSMKHLLECGAATRVGDTGVAYYVLT